MSPANAETFYNMAVPGDMVKVVGSPRAGEWGNGWTMWFLSWNKWARGSALHQIVHVGPRGSTFVTADHASHRARGSKRPSRKRSAP
jgi:hypothetical protein